MIKWQPCFHFYLAILLRTEANKEALIKSAPNNSIQYVCKAGAFTYFFRT